MSSVMDALHSFTKIEVFENFPCDGCKSRVNMEKQFKVEQAPEVLVIQLKRFQNLGSAISKIQTKVEYQPELDLNPFLSTPEDVSPFFSFNQIPHAPKYMADGHFFPAETSIL
jgi:ubiquitin carboxyl-terminal hydrolase 36/42